MVRCGPAVNSHIAVFSRWLVEVLDRVHWRTDYHRAWGASRHGRGTTAASSDAEGCSVESVDASDKFPSTSGSAHVRLIHNTSLCYICDAFLLNEAYVADSKVEQQAFICVKGVVW